VQSDKGGLRRPFRDSAPKAGLPVGFFCQIPPLPLTPAVGLLKLYQGKNNGKK